MTRPELINLVKTKIDEVSPPDGKVVLSGTRDKPLDILADSFLDECAREVLMKAPLTRLRTKSSELFPVERENGSGYVLLPDDFVRLAEFRMKGWERPVNEVVTAGSDEAKKQYNKFLCGAGCKPVCILVNRGSLLALEYYSVKAPHIVESFEYVSRTVAEEMPVDIQPVVSWFCAAKILAVTGKADGAKYAYEFGVNLF